jgi:hypothetical protein
VLVTVKPLQEDNESFENVPTTVEPSRQTDVQVCIMCLLYITKIDQLRYVLVETHIKTRTRSFLLF